jgi:L-amino acid N-acyltransferase YncA
LKEFAAGIDAQFFWVFVYEEDNFRVVRFHRFGCLGFAVVVSDSRCLSLGMQFFPRFRSFGAFTQASVHTVERGRGCEEGV